MAHEEFEKTLARLLDLANVQGGEQFQGIKVGDLVPQSGGKAMADLLARLKEKTGDDSWGYVETPWGRMVMRPAKPRP